MLLRIAWRSTYEKGDRMVSTGWMQQEGGTERDRALWDIGGLKVKPKGLEQWLQTLLGCPGTPSPLPSSLPRCCGGSLALCWKRPLCSSHGRRRRTVRRPHHRRCCRSSQTTGSLRHRAWVRQMMPDASLPCSSLSTLLLLNYCSSAHFCLALHQAGLPM